MKKIFTLAFIVLSFHVFAQKDSLKAYNLARINTTSHGMEVLGGWGLINLGTGAYLNWGAGTKTITVTIGDNMVPEKVSAVSQELQYFGQMNAVWGGVDFLTALLGYSGTQRLKNKNLSAAEVLKQQKRIEKIFKINMCLDVVYIGAGAYLKLEGDSRNSVIMKGYGESVLMQGGFLLFFDALMYKAEKNNGNKLAHFFEKHPITFDGRRVGIIFNM
jgi:hypothetical protein